jgi:AP-3 complex subunit mu
MPPVVNHSKYYLISIYRSGIFLLATTMRETQPLIVIEFLHRVFEIFEEYFGSISDENTIKENFATIYQLLEEMMDFGYPIITEPNTLRDMVSPPNTNILTRITNATIGGSTVSDVLPDGTVSNMPWRKTGVKYSQNEVYVDIVEEVDAVVDRNGSLISSEVTGIVTANCRLSGVPDLLLTFMNPQLIDDNCSFHPCVRYSRFEKDKVISFVPPDGVFELMRYRVNTDGPASGPCYCQPLISFDYPNNQGSMTLQVGAKPSHSIVISNGKNQALVVSMESLPLVNNANDDDF